MAVFRAFSQALRESRRRFVVLDAAPTGHTLLLLDATGAYHRDIMLGLEHRRRLRQGDHLGQCRPCRRGPRPLLPHALRVVRPLPGCVRGPPHGVYRTFGQTRKIDP